MAHGLHNHPPSRYSSPPSFADAAVGDVVELGCLNLQREGMVLEHGGHFLAGRLDDTSWKQCL
jgi:hypothetical protein